MMLEFIEAWFGFVQDVQCSKIFPGNDQQQVFIGRNSLLSSRYDTSSRDSDCL
jgi:hypothetical protein